MAILLAARNSGACFLCALAVVASKTISKLSCLFEQSVDAFGRDRQALLASPRQSLGFWNDAGHDHRAERLASLELVHEIRADVAGTQNSSADVFHGFPLCEAN